MGRSPNADPRPIAPNFQRLAPIAPQPTFYRRDPKVGANLSLSVTPAPRQILLLLNTVHTGGRRRDLSNPKL